MFDFQSRQLSEVWLRVIVDKLTDILYAVHVSLTQLVDDLPLLVGELSNGLEPLEVCDGGDLVPALLPDLGGHRRQRLS